MFREILEDRKGGNCGNIFLTHDAHGFIKLRGVVDGLDAGLRGPERPRLAHAVHAHLGSQARCFLDGGSELRFGVLILRGEFSIAENVAARFVNLHEVRTFFMLLANRGNEFVGGVRVIGVRPAHAARD